MNVKIIQLIYSTSKFDEDKITLEYMEKFGIDNVRGGSYSMMNINDEQRKLIIRAIRNANDECLECGSREHFINQCPNKWVKELSKKTKISK
jgi:lysophospholipid acyltransferase (LPLAT)-like uncharacterized protein